jgi:RNA recognition motif-containing protein
LVGKRAKTQREESRGGEDTSRKRPKTS